LERGILFGESAVGGVEKEIVSSFSTRSATHQNEMKKLRRCDFFLVFALDDPAKQNVSLFLGCWSEKFKVEV
jgi:hypothetical protein